jgi:hypothetical protein
LSKRRGAFHRVINKKTHEWVFLFELHFKQRYTFKMVIDIELTLNRFGFGKIAENKYQFLWLRFSRWKIPNKYSISFEINWRVKDGSKTI